MQEAACEDAVAAYVDVAGFLFNVVKEDIICKKIRAARRRWSAFKSFERRFGGRRRSSQQVEVRSRHFRWANRSRQRQDLNTGNKHFRWKCKGGTTNRRDWHVGEGHCSRQVRVFSMWPRFARNSGRNIERPQIDVLGYWEFVAICNSKRRYYRSKKHQRSPWRCRP